MPSWNIEPGTQPECPSSTIVNGSCPYAQIPPTDRPLTAPDDQPRAHLLELVCAMARLLAGEPLHTDGALTKENLAHEAKVSHATVHRAEEVLAEWDARVARPVLRPLGEVQRDEVIADLRRGLREATTRATELQGRLDVFATVTANLYYEDLELKMTSVQKQRRWHARPSVARALSTTIPGATESI
jgi:hypothetical protein